MGIWTKLLDVLRGVLIGAAEVVPGVSGGTIALLVGVYNTLIGSASVVVRALVGVFSPSRAELWREVSRLPWWRLIAILVGMGSAVVLAARILEPLIESYPEHTRGLFAGLILASLVVPLRMAGGIKGWTDSLVLAVAAALTFALTGLPAGSIGDPSWWIVMLAAALAICALVLPGVSGSFLLLSIGLYEPTIQAVNDRNLGYLGVFALGAIVGLGSFVVVLQWLLTHRQRITLLVMTGLMAGSLRALWPWQTDQRELLAIGSNGVEVAGWVAVGLVVVSAMVWLERRYHGTHAG
jgi:putative membrane protein